MATKVAEYAKRKDRLDEPFYIMKQGAFVFVSPDRDNTAILEEYGELDIVNYSVASNGVAEVWIDYSYAN